MKLKNLDFNEAYSASLDEELFTVHLMFEEVLPGDVTASPLKSNFERSNFLLPSYVCPTEQGDLAYEGGLEQVSSIL